MASSFTDTIYNYGINHEVILIIKSVKGEKTLQLRCELNFLSRCDTKVEEDGQQTETTIVPANCTKRLLIITANPTKRKRLEKQPRATQGKEGEQAQYLTEMEGLHL